MLQQKKKLLPLFNKARQKGKRVSWKVVADEYCFYIDVLMYDFILICRVPNIFCK